jgi:hypothetical protein
MTLDLRLASNLLATALEPFLGTETPADLGGRALRYTSSLLEKAGYSNAEDQGEVFSRVIATAREELRASSPERPQDIDSWFLGLCRSEVDRFVESKAVEDQATINALLDGSLPYRDGFLRNPERVYQAIRTTVDSLPVPYREFIVLDLIESVPRELVVQRLGLRDEAEYRWLKKAAFLALRIALGTVLSN